MAEGALKGAKTAAQEWLKKTVFCFAKGTLIWTTVGLVSIENIQPDDVVYAKEAEGIEQSVDVTQDAETAPVLEVFSHEVDETYIVTIDGEDIETTAEHPFYDENGEQVEAQDLQEGDELSTEEGDTATVDSVECVHHDEPVTVYNFCVMEDHTYFVGEHGVLVHNSCDGSSREISLPAEKTHDSARKTLLKELDDTGAFSNGSEPYFGRLEKSYGFNKQIGRQSLDGKVRWRLDFDDKIGTHYNIEDFSAGKGVNAVKKVIPIDISQNEYMKIIDLWN